MFLPFGRSLKVSRLLISHIICLFLITAIPLFDCVCYSIYSYKQKGFEMIEKNIAITVNTSGKFPLFKEMVVGDSVRIEPHLYLEAQRYAHTYAASVGKKFSTRKQADGSLRVWRVA